MRKLIPIMIWLIPVGTLCQSPPPRADAPDSNTWVTLGIGRCAGPHDERDDHYKGSCWGGVAALSNKFGSNIISVRGLYATTGDYERTGDTMWDMGTSTGGSGIHGPPCSRSAQVWESQSMSTQEKTSRSAFPSRPSDLAPTRVIGIGLYGFANINAQQSVRGVAFALQMGSLRPHRN